MGRIKKEKVPQIKGIKNPEYVFTPYIPTASINKGAFRKKPVKEKLWDGLKNSGIDKPFINPISETKETKESLDFIARVDNVRKHGVSKDDIKKYKMISNKHINKVLNNDGKKSW